MTPPEFGALDEDIRRFYTVAWNERQRRVGDKTSESEDELS